MKPINSHVKLRWISWEGKHPEPGDGLVTTTGRRYLILHTKGQTMQCQVIGPEEAVPGRVHQWQWSERARSAKT